MYSYHFREWLSFFYFYCIFGWCFESVYVSLKNHRPVNRGFMKGPWLPLYGTGAILVLWLTLPFQGTPVLVYIAGALGATVLEYVTGEAMVRLFKIRYWDYSDQRFQYKGHICLSSTIVWGFLSLLMVYVMHRQVEHVIFWLNEELVSVLTFVITVCMVYDFSSAFRKAMDLRDLLIQAEAIRGQMEERLAEKKRLMEATGTFVKAAAEETLQDRREQLAERMKNLEQELRQFELQQEGLKDKMMKNSRQLLLHNPGAKLMSRAADTEELKERMRNLKEKFLGEN